MPTLESDCIAQTLYRRVGGGSSIEVRGLDRDEEVREEFEWVGVGRAAIRKEQGRGIAGME